MSVHISEAISLSHASAWTVSPCTDDRTTDVFRSSHHQTTSSFIH